MKTIGRVKGFKFKKISMGMILQMEYLLNEMNYEKSDSVEM